MTDQYGSVAAAMVAQLAAAGVERVYGVVGDAVFSFADALGKESSIQFVSTAHEESAAFMASYEAKLTGRLAVCMATAGPGAANLANGVADAHFDGAPLLVITGQVESAKIGTGEKQYFDQQAFFRPITARTGLVLSADAALNELVRAIAQATMNRQVVHMSIPKDVFGRPVKWTPMNIGPIAERTRMNGASTNGASMSRASTNGADANGAVPRATSNREGRGTADNRGTLSHGGDLRALRSRGVRNRPDEGGSPLAHSQEMSNLDRQLILGDWERAVDAVRASERPIVAIGDLDQDVVRQALALAKSLGAAVVAAQQAKGKVPYATDLLIGGIGEAHVPPIVEKADLLILVGECPYELEFFPKSLPMIAVARSPQGFPGRPLIAEAVGGLATSLEVLRSTVDHRLGAGRPRNEAWLEAIRGTRDALARQVVEVEETDRRGPINPYHLALALGDVLADDAIVTLDIGAFSHWFDLGFRAERQEVLTSWVWRSVGAGLPAAIAAKMAKPHRQVVAVVGDGALMMALGELATAVRYQVPVVIAVARNDTYDIEAQMMTTEGLANEGTSLVLPDLPSVAKAFGVRAMRAESPRTLRSELKTALADTARLGGPVLLDVHTSVPVLPHLVTT